MRLLNSSFPNFIAITLIALGTLTCVRVNAGNTESLGWQKLQLEATLEARVRESVHAIVKSENILARTEVVLTPSPRKAREILSGEGFSLGKLDLLASEVPDFDDGHIDIFDSIQKVRIHLTLEKSIIENSKEKLEHAVVAAVNSATSVKTEVDFDSFDPSSLESTGDKAVVLKEDWSEKLLGQALPLAVLIATAVLATTLIYLGRIVQRTASSKTETRARNSVESLEPSSRSITSHDATDSTSQSEFPLSRQVSALLESHPHKIASLVRRWIAADSESSREALRTLPRLITLTGVLRVSMELDERAKSQWRAIIEDSVTSWNESRAQGFIADEILEDALRMSPPHSDELQQLLEKTSPEECSKLVSEDAKIGAVLVSLMSPSKAARLLALLKPSVRFKVIEYCPNLNVSDLNRLTPVIREALMRKRDNDALSNLPFVDRAIDLIREIGLELEEDIYASLVGSFEADAAINFAFRICPAKVIREAKPNFHKTALNTISLAQRAELLFSAEPARRANLIAAYGPGEKIRELLDAELLMIEQDPHRSIRAQREGDKLWRSYVQTCRKLIHADSSVQDLIRDQIVEWLDHHASLRVESQKHAA